MKNKNTNVKLYADVTNKLPIIKVFYHFIMNASNEIENYEWTGLYLFNNKHWGVSSSRALPISNATQVEIIPRWGHSEWFDTWADTTQLKNKNDVAHSALLQTTPPPRLSLSPTTFICRPELLILTLFGPSLTPTPKTWRGSRWAEVANRTPSESRRCLLVGWCLRGVPRIHMWQQRTMRRAADALPAPGRSWELRAESWLGAASNETSLLSSSIRCFVWLGKCQMAVTKCEIDWRPVKPKPNGCVCGERSWQYHAGLWQRKVYKSNTSNK